MSGEMRLSMLVTANTQAAVAGVKAVSTATDQLVTTTRQAAKETGAVAPAVLAIGKSSDSAASSILKSVNATEALDAAVKALLPSIQRLQQPMTAMGTFAALGDSQKGLSEIAADLRLATEEAQLYQSALDQVRARYDPLFAASKRYEMELRDIAEAEKAGAISAGVAVQARERAAQIVAPLRQIGQAAQTSGHYVSQLGFQFNDIAMMMAAGQNPLMLMMQQGTQVTQVFDQMRKDGQSVGASIRSSLLSMVSPMNVVTMGAIALGAYAVQALFSTGDAADHAREAVDDLAKTTDGFKRAADAALKPTKDLKEAFGETAAEARKLLAEIAQVEGWKASQKAAAAGDAIRKDIGLNLFVDDMANQKSLIDKFGLNTWEQSAWDTVRGMQEAFRSFDATASIEDPLRRVQEQYKAINDLRDRWAVASDADGNRSAEEQRILTLLSEQVLEIMKQKAQQEELLKLVSARAIEDARAKGNESARMGGPLATDTSRQSGDGKADKGRQTANDLIAAARQENELARLKLVYGEQSVQVRQAEATAARAAVEAKITELQIDRQGAQAQDMRAAAADKLKLAEDQRIANQSKASAEIVAQYQAEAQIAQLTAQYGANSLEVAYARSAAERDVVAAQIEAQGYTGQQAADLLAAWDAARGIAGVNMAAGISAAGDAARVLAAQLGVSLAVALQLANFDPSGGAGKPGMGGASRLGFGAGSGGLGFGSGTSLGYGDLNDSASFKSADIPKITAPKGGGGGGAKKETNEVKQLIEQLERENAVLKILDPVQREIEQNHKALAKATVTEKASVADLIAERQRLEAIRDALDEIGRTGKDAFVGLITGASTFKEALAQVLSKLAEMAASSAWDMLWGGSSGGGLGSLLGGLFSGGVGTLFEPKADGGLIGGAGGPREDNHLIRASTGEFIVNASATKSALPLLHAINAGVPMDRLVDLIGGRRPRFADGGMVGDVGSAAPSGWRAGRSSALGGGVGASGAQPMALDVRMYVDRDGNWQAAVEGIAGKVAVKTTKAGLEQFSRHGMNSAVRKAQAEPRRV